MNLKQLNKDLRQLNVLEEKQPNDYIDLNTGPENNISLFNTCLDYAKQCGLWEKNEVITEESMEANFEGGLNLIKKKMDKGMKLVWYSNWYGKNVKIEKLVRLFAKDKILCIADEDSFLLFINDEYIGHDICGTFHYE